MGPQGPGSGNPDNAADFRADMDVLNQEDDAAPPNQEEGEEDQENLDEGEEGQGAEEEDEEGEGEEGEDGEEGEGEEDKEEEPEPTPGHARPTLAQIKAKYPEFFKDFPDMRHVFFREGEYTKIFPTVEDARDASARAEDFTKFSDLLSSGKPEDFKEFVAGVKEAGSLTPMAANFLPALYEADRDMYFKVTTPVAESLLRNAFAQASQAGNDNLKNAALHLAQWAFGDVAYATGEKRSPDPRVEAKPATDPNLEKERQDFMQMKYNDARSYVNDNSRNRLTAEIRRGLDPNNAFTPAMQNLLVKEILSEIGDSLEADESHMRVMNSLWKQARRANFAGDWRDRILSAYLSRARRNMPEIRNRLRGELLNNEEHRGKIMEKRAERSANRRDVQGSPHSSGKTNGRPPAAQEIDWSRTSDMDLLNDRVTLKKR